MCNLQHTVFSMLHLIFFNMSINWSGVAEGALGTLGNFLGSSAGAAQQWKYQQKQNAWSEKMMQQQQFWNQQNAATAYQRQVDFYNLQNEYNSPVNQIARLRSAGINPNLAYSNGSLNNVGASVPSVAQAESASPSSSSASVSTGSFGSLGSNFIQMYQMSEQNKVLQAQANKIQKEGQKLDFDNRIRSMTWLDEAHALGHSYKAKSTLEDIARETLEQARISTQKARTDLSYQVDTLNDRKVIVNLQRQQGEINNELNRTTLRLQQAKLPYANKMAWLEYRQAVQNILLMVSQGVYNRAAANAAYNDAVLKAAQSVTEKSRRDNLDSATDYNDALRYESYQRGFNSYVHGVGMQKDINFKYPGTFKGILIDNDGSVNVQGIKDFTKDVIGLGIQGYNAYNFSKSLGKVARPVMW